MRKMMETATRMPARMKTMKALNIVWFGDVDPVPC
jgi:hypothetical protein